MKSLKYQALLAFYCAALFFEATTLIVAQLPTRPFKGLHKREKTLPPPAVEPTVHEWGGHRPLDNFFRVPGFPHSPAHFQWQTEHPIKQGLRFLHVALVECWTWVGLL